MGIKYQLKNVTISYEDKIIKENLNLNIKSGKLTAIVGASGTGKSSLLYILGTLMAPSTGEVFLDNEKLPKINSKESRKLLSNKIGFLFQNFALIDNETVFENLKIVCKNREEILKCLELFNLEDKIDTKISLLSGGEQQRIALSRLILKDSDIILADEPTGSLDRKNELFVMNLLKELTKKEKTVIVVTHSENIIDQFDEVIRL